jgi:hypothetical protein
MRGTPAALPLRNQMDGPEWKRHLYAVVADPRLYAWLGLVVAIICVFQAIPSKLPDMWVSSDTLWPVNLFTDTLGDGFPFGGWRFSIAPCWVPDIVLVGLCYLFVRNPVMATLLAGAAQFVIFLAGLLLCWRSLKLTCLKLLDALTLSVGIAITLWVAFHTDVWYPGFFQFLLPQTHIGNLIMQVYTLWLTALMVRARDRRHEVKIGIGYAVVCMCAGLSNLMFFPHTLVPLSAGLVVLTAIRALPPRRVALPLIIGWPAAVAGAIAFRMLFTVMGLTDQSALGWAAWQKATRVFYAGMAAAFAKSDLQHIVAALWLIACMIASVILLRGLRGAAGSEREARAPAALFFITAAAGAMLGPATVIAGGSNGLTQFNNYRWTMHYLHPTFLLPLFAWPALFGLLRPLRPPRIAMFGAAWAAAAVWVAVPAVTLARAPAPPVPVYQYVPEYVRSLDEQAKKYGIKYGVAGYWQARVITLLSRTGLRAYQVDGSLNPLIHVSNAEWYKKSVEDRTRRPCFSFVVLDDRYWKISRATVVSRFGEPEHELNTGGVPVLVYSRSVSPRCLDMPF